MYRINRFESQFYLKFFIAIWGMINGQHRLNLIQSLHRLRVLQSLDQQTNKQINGVLCVGCLFSQLRRLLICCSAFFSFFSMFVLVHTHTHEILFKSATVWKETWETWQWKTRNLISNNPNQDNIVLYLLLICMLFDIILPLFFYFGFRLFHKTICCICVSIIIRVREFRLNNMLHFFFHVAEWTRA